MGCFGRVFRYYCLCRLIRYPSYVRRRPALTCWRVLPFRRGRLSEPARHRWHLRTAPGCRRVRRLRPLPPTWRWGTSYLPRPGYPLSAPVSDRSLPQDNSRFVVHLEMEPRRCCFREKSPRPPVHDVLHLEAAKKDRTAVAAVFPSMRLICFFCVQHGWRGWDVFSSRKINARKIRLKID